jgi:recombination DNA repair RAD52 pathway protein
LSDDANIEQLLKSLELTKEQVHNLNLRKMDPNRIRTEKDVAEESEMGRNYPLLEATTTAKTALENRAKLSSFISTVNPEDAKRIDMKLDRAMDTFVSADSPSKIDSWYREQLSLLLIEIERTGKVALQSTSWRSTYHPKDRKPRSEAIDRKILSRL